MRGFNVANGLSRASAATGSIGLTDHTTKAERIAPVHASKKPIACVEILEPSHRKVLIPLEPSHALRSALKTKENFRQKNGHSRPPKVVAGPAEKYSERSLRAAAMPLDPATAEYQRQANNADRIRAETAWGRRSVSAPDGYVVSDWKPCLPSDHATLPDLTIPAFLRRTA